ncbi:hypothetical protein HUS23_12075 [Ectothiorhodospiraceae bacterium 2226]|nr:hypothetical protein HUS23_12075 [Ectothiorhodospiraceae bacterium 2226]
MRFHDINASGWWTVAFWLVVGGGTVGAIQDEAVLLVLGALVLLVILPGNPRYGAPGQWTVCKP